MVAKVKTKKGTVLVTGASRGLGLEFVRQYLNDGWNVIATSQKPEKATALKRMIADGAPLDLFQLDVTDAASVARLAKGLKGRAVDVLINNSGIAGKGAWGRGGGKGKQQTFGSIDYVQFVDIFATNTLGPLMVAEALFANVKKAKGKIITISSMGGSIKGTFGPHVDYVAYAVSKAGVNMAMRASAAHMQKGGVTVVNFCPGWVRTEMGGKAAPLSPEQSIGALRKTIAKLTLKDTGRYVDRNGKDIPW